MPVILAMLASACSQPSPTHKPPATPTVASAPPVPAAPPTIIAPPPIQTAATAPGAASLPPAGQAIDAAQAPAPPGQGTYDPALVRLEVLLDRAGFSPGVIDGRDGSNLRRAVAAYAQATSLSANGDMAAALAAMAAKDPAPAMQTYSITASDIAGPFIGPVPKDYKRLARLPALGYSSPEQRLAETFHMDTRLLEALNPGVDFGAPGQILLVTVPRPGPRDYQAGRIVVDKSQDQVRVFDNGGRLAAVYPATVGSTERPAPSGVFAVRAVAKRPAYFYDPKRLTFTPEGAEGKLKIAPGPNNPVGSTWIALTLPTYGIHGSPNPSLIGKRQSHGCVRLTNWDAAELGLAAKKGVEVDFVGREAPPGAA
jgi:lipoprotein-anchoring transpeptidase ErfK/SrfK